MQRIVPICFAFFLSLSTYAFDLSILPHFSIGDNAGDDTIAGSVDNDTVNATSRATYAAKVVIVDLARCRYELQENLFYRGLIVNTFGYRGALECYDWTSYRVGKQNEATSSAWGPSNPSKVDKPYYTWDWLQFPDGKDLRSAGFDIEFRAWNALPQMYFPLLSPADAKLGGKWAYMLWVKPNALLVNSSSDYRDYGNCGFMRTAAVTRCPYLEVYNKKYFWTIRIADLIRNLQTDLTSNALAAYTYHGAESGASGATQTQQNSYTDVNNFALQSTTQGDSGQGVCGWNVAATEDHDILMLKMKKVITWL